MRPSRVLVSQRLGYHHSTYGRTRLSLHPPPCGRGRPPFEPRTTPTLLARIARVCYCYFHILKGLTATFAQLDNAKEGSTTTLPKQPHYASPPPPPPIAQLCAPPEDRCYRRCDVSAGPFTHVRDGDMHSCDVPLPEASRIARTHTMQCRMVLVPLPSARATEQQRTQPLAAL